MEEVSHKTLTFAGHRLYVLTYRQFIYTPDHRPVVCTTTMYLE